MNEIKDYKLNLDEIAKSFSFEKGLSHKHSNKFRLLPYVANDKNLDINYTGVTGAFSRAICNKELEGEFDEDSIIIRASEQIGEYEGINSKEIFKDIVRSMFIDNHSLVNFSIHTLNYITSTNKEEKIAKFLESVLSSEELKESIVDYYNKDVSNVIYKLILDSLPNLKNMKITDKNYKSYLPFIKKLFIEDFKFLISNEDLYKESLQRLLEFYYMFYVSQLSMKLSKFEKADINNPEKLYYTLSWESTSKNRTAYKFGWELLKSNINSLFSHAVTLELLNYHGYDEQLTYGDFFELFNNIDKERPKEEIEILIGKYKSHIKDVDWNKLILRDNDTGNIAYDKVIELYQTVEYQFVNSGRNRAYEAYRNWFVKFVNERFSKKRGPLGYNLNITEDDIILMTKLCIKNRGKLKLNLLFNEFENRGIYFDRDSKIKIIQLYEKLNLLEKKSDSGDAQYVRSIL